MKNISSKVQHRKRKRKASENEASVPKIKRNDAISSDERVLKGDGFDVESVKDDKAVENGKDDKAEVTFDDVIKMLRLPQSRNTGLKKFAEVCRKDDEHVKQSITSYLLSSPELKDLFILLESEDRPSDHEARLIWNAFESILLVTSNAEKSLHDIGMFIVSKILSKNLKMLYSGISLSSHQDLTKSVLKLLTSFVAQGTNGAAEVLNVFDFGLKGFEAISKKRDKKAKIDVRTCYLQLYLSFFIFGDQSVMKELLSIPVFTNGVISGLLKDPLPMVHLVLSTLNEKVVKNAKLMKKTKIALFSAQTLGQLAQLFVNLKNKDTDRTHTLQNELKSLILEMLHTLCTDPELGILFTTTEGYLAARSNNPILLNFLRTTQKLAVSDQDLRDLIAKTMHSAPDLVLPFISRLNLNLEPRDSDPWLKSIGYLIEIWSQLPLFDGLFDASKLSESLELVVGLVFPSVFGKQHFTNGLKHKSLLVKQKSTELLEVCLKRGLSAYRFIKEQTGSQKDIGNGLLEKFHEGIFNNMPDVKTLIACVEHKGHTDSKPEATGSPGNVTEKTTPGMQEDKFQKTIFHVMLYVQQLQPGIFSSADYSICKLFKNEDMETFLQSEQLLVALNIALLEPFGNIKWFAKKSDIFYNALKTIYTAYAESRSLNVKEASQKLIKRLVFASGSIAEHFDEVVIWLSALSTADVITKERAIASFFLKTCVSATQDLYYITDEILGSVSTDVSTDVSLEGPTDDEWLHPQEHPIIYSVGFTPLVIAALRNFAKPWSSEDEPGREPISKFVCFVLMDVLMSQENAHPLMSLINKYISIIEKITNAASSGWFSYWLGLQGVARYWCSDWSQSVNTAQVSIDKETTKMMPISTAAILRSWLPFTSQELSYDSHTISETVDAITRIHKETAISLFQDVTSRSIRVVLNVLRKSFHLTSQNVSSFAVHLLKKILMVYVERECEVSEIVMSSTRAGAEKNRKQHEETLQVLLDDQTIKKLFLNSERLEDAEHITEMIGVLFGNRNWTFLTNSLRPYFNELSTSVLLLVQSLKDDQDSIKNRNSKLVLNTLEVMANHMAVKDRIDLLRNLSSLLLTCNFGPSFLQDSGLVYAMKHLLDLKNEKIMLLEEVMPSSCATENPTETTDAEMSDVIEVRSKVIAALFNLLEKYDNSDLRAVVLSLLEAENLNAHLAPISAVDFCLRSGSEASIEILKKLCQSSVGHATVTAQRLTNKREELSPSSLVHLMHTLVFNACTETKARWDVFTEICLQELMPLVSNTDDNPQMKDEEIEMALETISTVIEDKETLLTMLVKALQKLQKSHQVSDKWRYQIQLFQDVCVPEKATKHESKLIIESLVYLMKTWEHTLSSKGLAELLEQAITKCISKICESLQKGCISKLKDKTVKQLVQNWSSLLPSCLKRRIGHPGSLGALQSLLTLLYSMKSFNEESQLTLENVYQFSLSHSQFLAIVLQDDFNGKRKDALLGLLTTIAEFGVKVYEKPHLSVFMAAYHCTLSPTDRKILHLLRFYEENGIPISSLRPLVWGKKALELRRENTDLDQTLYNQTEMKDVIESLDRNTLVKSAFNFPLKMDVTNNDEDDHLSLPREDIYDPRFLFPLFSRFLDQDCKVDCRRFIDSGCLAFVVAGMSSQVLATRRTAFHVMARFMNQIHASRFAEKNQIVILLDALKNSVNEEAEYIPSIISIFVLRCLQILLRPDQHLYPKMNHFLLKGPFLDTRNVPLLTQMLNSSDLEYVTERSWIIQLMAAGLRTPHDYYIYKKNQVFQQIMSLYNSPLCDVTAKKPIRDVMIAASQIHQAAFDLIKSNGLLSWLQCHIEPSLEDQIRFLIDVLNSLTKTFKQGIEIVNEEGETGKKTPLPQQFTTECTMLCLRLINECSQNLRMEELLGLTDVLSWCLSVEGGIIVAGWVVTWRQIKSLLEFVDRFARDENRCSDEVGRKVLENTAIIARRWLELSKDIVSAFCRDRSQDLCFLCCWMLRLVRRRNVTLETITSVFCTVSTVNSLCSEWNALLPAHGEAMAEFLIELALFNSSPLHPEYKMDSLLDFKRVSDQLRGLAIQTTRLAANVVRPLLVYEGDLQGCKSLVTLNRRLKSEKYQYVVQHYLPKLDSSLHSEQSSASGEKESLYGQALLLLLISALKGKEDPSDVTAFIENFTEDTS